MEIRYESLEFKEKNIQEKFSANFVTQGLTEAKFATLSDGVDGYFKKFHLNEVFVWYQNYINNTTLNSEIWVTYGAPVFLLQYSLEGRSEITSAYTTTALFSLSSGCYNLFYLPPGKYRHRYLTKNRIFFNVYFTEVFIEKKIGKIYCEELRKKIELQNFETPQAFFSKGFVLTNALRNIIRHFVTNSYINESKKSYYEAKITELLVVTLAVNNDIGETHFQHLIQVEEYIQRNLKEDLSIEKLSVIAGCNTSKFKNDFKRKFHMPVFKYITSVRIEKATQLILKRNFTISQASYEVGYKNPQHFTVAFKKKMGYLPSELIQQKKEL